MEKRKDGSPYDWTVEQWEVYERLMTAIDIVHTACVDSDRKLSDMIFDEPTQLVSLIYLELFRIDAGKTDKDTE